jgi:hypothetical protein
MANATHLSSRSEAGELTDVSLPLLCPHHSPRLPFQNTAGLSYVLCAIGPSFPFLSVGTALATLGFYLQEAVTIQNGWRRDS